MTVHICIKFTSLGCRTSAACHFTVPRPHLVDRILFFFFLKKNIYLFTEVRSCYVDQRDLRALGLKCATTSDTNFLLVSPLLPSSNHLSLVIGG